MFYYKRFREIRRDRLISQEEIANRMGIKQTQYSRYERGAQEMPLHLAIFFAGYTGCSLDYLTELTEIDRGIPENQEAIERYIQAKTKELDEEERKNLLEEALEEEREEIWLEETREERERQEIIEELLAEECQNTTDPETD